MIQGQPITSMSKDLEADRLEPLRSAFRFDLSLRMTEPVGEIIIPYRSDSSSLLSIQRVNLRNRTTDNPSPTTKPQPPARA